MTAVNVIRDPARGCIHVVADAAGLDPQGCLTLSFPKIVPLPQFNAVLAVRGTISHVLTLGACMFRHAESYDGLKSTVGEMLQREFRKIRSIAAPDDMLLMPFDLCLASISETTGTDAYLVTSNDGNPGIAPWTVVDLPWGILAPPIGEAWSSTIANHGDPLSLMPAILAEQRKVINPTASGALGPFVGAFAQVFTIARRSITSRIIGTWPSDRNGRMGGHYGPRQLARGVKIARDGSEPEIQRRHGRGQPRDDAAEPGAVVGVVLGERWQMMVEGWESEDGAGGRRQAGGGCRNMGVRHGVAPKTCRKATDRTIIDCNQRIKSF
jgi:hypothetical protein